MKRLKKKGKACETNQTNNIRNWIWVSGQVPVYVAQRPAYARFNLHTHAHDMRAWTSSKTLTQKLEIENRAQTRKALILTI